MFKLKRWQFWLFHFILSMVMGIISIIPSALNSPLLAILFLTSVILDMLVIAGRIKDYGHNPWRALLVFIPLVNIFIIFFYGFAKHKKDASDSDNGESTKNKIEEPSHITIHENSSNANTQDIDENELYRIVNQEIKEDKKDEALWLKALQEADGDKDKTLARYVGYRVPELKEEQENQRRKEEQNILEQEEQRRKEEQNLLEEESRQKENERLRAEEERKKQILADYDEEARLKEIKQALNQYYKS